MDFHTSFQQELLTFDEFEYEDDVFYCELRRQVLQLTAEDDDREEFYENKNSNAVAAAGKQGLNNGPCGDDHAAPAWILNLWRTGNGTGVFIPQVTQSRRKNRPSIRGTKEDEHTSGQKKY
ncbi:hypothetical protein Pfo_023786, partial [Paulownia fortunei]